MSLGTTARLLSGFTSSPLLVKVVQVGNFFPFPVWLGFGGAFRVLFSRGDSTRGPPSRLLAQKTKQYQEDQVELQEEGTLLCAG